MSFEMPPASEPSQNAQKVVLKKIYIPNPKWIKKLSGSSAAFDRRRRPARDILGGIGYRLRTVGCKRLGCGGFVFQGAG